ncbi:MAG: chromosome segregation protein [Thermoleophilia bacterium]|nr:chromosome segregation protein [Thermoleophilia bacterium]
MRVRALELRRFGHFEDAVLDFGEGRGLHVVHGPNEAGKSTTLDALRYTLYGMPSGGSREPKYDLLHKAGKIRTAIRLGLDDGGELAFARSRSTKASVHDIDTDAADPGLAARLAAVLAGVPKELWRSKHGIDQAALRDGARALIDGAATGEALYAVATGMGGARRVLEGLRAERAALLADSGRAGAVHDAVADYREARSAFDRARRAAAGYDDAVAQLTRLAQRADEVREQELRLGHDRDRLARAIDAAPDLEQRAQLVAALDAIHDAPVGWSDAEHRALAEALGDAGRTQADIARLERRVQQLGAKRSGLAVDEALLAAAGPLDALHQRIGAVAGCIEELPALRADAAAAADAVRRAATALDASGATEPGDLLPPEAACAALADLLDEVAVLDTAVDQARREAEQAQRTADSARAAVDEGAGAGDDELAALDAALAVAMRIDEAELTSLAARLDRTRDAIEQRVAQLAGLPDDLDVALRVELPGDAARALLEERFEVLAAERAEAADRLALARQKQAEQSALLAELEAGRDVPDPVRLDELRRSRDDAWGAIRSTVLAASALDDATVAVAGFERSVSDADHYADDLARDAERVGQANELRRRVAADERRAADATARLAELDVEAAALDAAWATLWAPSTLEVGTPAQMRETTEALAAVRAACEQVELEREGLAARTARLAGARTDLAAALGLPAGAAVPTLATLVEQATARRAVLAADRDAAASVRGELKAAAAAVAARGRQLDAATQERAALEVPLRRALGAAGVPEGVEVAGARRHLDALAQLRRCIEAEVEARRCVDSRTALLEAFEVEARRLAAGLGPEAQALAAADVQVAVTTLRARAVDAATSQARLAEIDAQLDEHRDELDAANVARAGAEATLARLRQHAGVDDLVALEVADRRWAEAEALRVRLAALDAAIAASARMTVADVTAVLDGRDAASVRVELERLDAEVAELSRQGSELGRERDAANQAVGAIQGSGEQAAAAARTLDARARLEQLVPEYRVLALQERMLAAMLDDRARRDMGPIVDRTGRYLEVLTCGAWTRMLVGIDDGGTPRVELERARDGEAVPLDGLSEGTADQLYLALRLATLVEGAGRGETMPLVVDDVLPSFDDERAAATMRLLGEVSEHLQVIFLTHHERLVDLAVAAVDSSVLHLHRLERFGRPALAAAPALTPIG